MKLMVSVSAQGSSLDRSTMAKRVIEITHPTTVAFYAKLDGKRKLTRRSRTPEQRQKIEKMRSEMGGFIGSKNALFMSVDDLVAFRREVRGLVKNLRDYQLKAWK